MTRVFPECHLRVDLILKDGSALMGVRVQGAGGLLTKGAFSRLTRRLDRPGEVIRVYTRWTAESGSYVDVPAANIKVISQAP